MKNITLSVDEETYRRVRIAAAERNTTVSALVRDNLHIFARPAEADVCGDPLPPGGGVRGSGLGGAVR